MSLQNKRIILTGAAGVVGGYVARLLTDAGASVTLTDVNEIALEKLRQELGSGQAVSVVADITSPEGRHKIIDSTLSTFGEIDTLINLAGVNPFGSFDEQDSTLIQKTIEINTVAPMLLAHDVLPIMHKQSGGHIVNIGSIFGSVAFAWFTAYSTSKFALRGFSQSLRRELVDTNIDVTYVSLRAVKTQIKSAAAYEMEEVIKVNMDEPADVAKEIVHAIEKRKKEHYIGFPWSLLAHVNAVFPGYVDSSLLKQNRIARPYILKKGITKKI